MNEFAKRRNALMRKVGRRGMVVLHAAPEMIRNGDVHHPYRQNSDFYYLTGFSEPQAVLVLVPGRRNGEYILFCRERDPAREKWDGPRAGLAGARRQFLADQAYPISQFEKMLPTLALGRKTIDALPLIHEMRLFKSPAEIAMIQKAVDISVVAHINAMQTCQPGMNECELDAQLTYDFKRQGAKFDAYGSIVGAGKNTCVLHYMANNQTIAKKDLVLIDAGAEYQNYAADITRTFPASGRFTDEQRAIYNLVLKAQQAAIKAVRPGVSWDKPQQIIVKVITQGLLDLGILKGQLNQLIKRNAYYPFYMHRSGHWLGLDVHDAGQYKIADKWRPFQAGMVFTVEPGIYISSDIKGVAKRWHHIGVRIEDDVLVTKTGCKVLSQGIPKTVTEIEALMARSS